MRQYFYYKLMTPGKKVIGIDEEGKQITQDVAFYSDMKKINARDEEAAREEIQKTKLKNKWTGFRLFPNG